MSDKLTIKFWGVRGSHPVPGSGTIRYGGNTACVEVCAAGQTLIFDAGTGIIALGNEMMARSKHTGEPVDVVLFLSHFHSDHTQGIPFFVPAYLPSTHLSLNGPGVADGGLESVMSCSMAPPTFPVAFHELSSHKELSVLQDGDTILIGKPAEKNSTELVKINPGQPVPDDDRIRVRVQRSFAHPGGVLVFRVDWRGRSLVYATDVEGYVGADRRLVEFARGADILIHDAQYSEEHYRGSQNGYPAVQGFGHSTASMASEVASNAGVGRLILFHHDPSYDDNAIAALEERSRKWFPETQAAYEGMEIIFDELEMRPVHNLKQQLAKDTNPTRPSLPAGGLRSDSSAASRRQPRKLS